MADDPSLPRATWLQEAGAWTLRLEGRWTEPVVVGLPPAPARTGSPLAVDGRGVAAWTPAGAAALWALLAPLARHETLALHRLPDGLRQLLELALPTPAAPSPAPVVAPRRPPHWVAAVGQGATAAVRSARLTLAFCGRVVLALPALLQRGGALRGADVLAQVERAGPRSVPIVALVCGLVGLILAYMGAAQLQRLGAQSFIADLVAIGVVREVAALMTGLILAGRVGAAYAAEIGSMQASEEIDALEAVGIDPVRHLVLPRLAAMLLVAPLLTAVAAAVAVGAGALVAVVVFGVPVRDFAARAAESLTPAHLAVGLVKGTVYAALVAVAGCRQGLAAGRSAEAVGRATTAAVVQAIVWIVVAASLLTVAFQRLGV